jgi:hypothetical protein
MHVELNEGSVPNAAEAVDLPGLDDENVTRPGLEFLPVDGPETAAFPHELDFVVRMTMGSRTTTGKGAEEEHGDVHIPVVGPDELVRAAMKWQVLLTNAVHPADAPGHGCDDCGKRTTFKIPLGLPTGIGRDSLPGWGHLD